MTPAFLNLLRQHVAAEVYRQLAPDDLWAKVRDELDEVAFRVLLERIGSRVYQRCRALLRDDHSAEEAFQDTFRDLIRKRAAIPSYHAAAAWAYQTATNHARYLRRKARFRWKRERDLRAEPAVSGTPHADHADEVDRLLAALPDRFRRPIELVYWQGLTHTEAAQALGWPKGTVDSYVAQGLKRMRTEARRLGIPAVLLMTVLARPAHAVSEAVADRLATAAWAAAGEPLAGAPRWLSWKALVAGVACAGVAAGGVAIGWRPNAQPAPALRPAVASGPGQPETLQAKNLRILHDEVLPRLRAELQRTMPSDNPVTVTDARAVGSEVEVELRPARPIPGQFPARLRLRYCVFRRQMSALEDVDKPWQWSYVPTVRFETSAVPNPLAPFAPLFVTRAVPTNDRWESARRVFAVLPPDPRAQEELIGELFVPPGGAFRLPAKSRGTSSFTGGLIVADVSDGLFVRNPAGRWRYAGECPGWWPVVAGRWVYCIEGEQLLARPLADPSAPWQKWCDLPPVLPGEVTCSLFVDGGRIWVARSPSRLYSRPVTGPATPWERTDFVGQVCWRAGIDGTVYGNDGLHVLVAGRVSQPEAGWRRIGPWPERCGSLIVDGNRLLAYDPGSGPIYSRPISAGSDHPWKVEGRIHDPYAPNDRP